MIVFRADASTLIGVGHVMRCVTLAESLMAEGHECRFICREHPGNLIEWLEGRGFYVHVLPVPALVHTLIGYAAFLGGSQQEDAGFCQDILSELNPEWIVVDHYGIGEEWEKGVAPFCTNILVIDDLADRTHYCDLLLDQTVGRSVLDYSGLVVDQCVVLCGAKYSLLRAEFATWREASLGRRKGINKVKHLLITMGGGDLNGATEKVLSRLSASTLEQLESITIVMGSSAPSVQSVKRYARELKGCIDVKVGVDNMAELMSKADFVLGAAGATAWERCCLGVPSMLVVLADNQRTIAKNLREAGAVELFSFEKQGAGRDEIDLSIFDSKCLEKMSRRAASITNGKGVNKVIEYMSERGF